MTEGETNTLAACGLEELFSSCAIVSVFVVVVGNSFRCYLPTIPVVPLCLVAQVSFLVVMGKSFRCYFLTNHMLRYYIFAIVGTLRYLVRWQKHSIFTKAQVEPTIGQLFWCRLYLGPKALARDA
jgi:hypothetical protein